LDAQIVHKFLVIDSVSSFLGGENLGRLPGSDCNEKTFLLTFPGPVDLTVRY